MSLVDTCSSQLILYVVVHSSKIHDVVAHQALRPEHVMSTTASRCWVPLHVKAIDAVTRAIWGCEEMGTPVTDPSKDLLVLQVRFSAVGVGHFLVQHMLTTWDWSHFRFYGDVPFRCTDHDGQTVLEVGVDVLAIV